MYIYIYGERERERVLFRRGPPAARARSRASAGGASGMVPSVSTSVILVCSENLTTFYQPHEQADAISCVPYLITLLLLFFPRKLDPALRWEADRLASRLVMLNWPLGLPILTVLYHLITSYYMLDTCMYIYHRKQIRVDM